jgi:parvulin-like peptidyl-prolyl isomerase
MNRFLCISFLIPFLILSGCKKDNDAIAEKPGAEKLAKSAVTATEPERVEVQHILISFQGAIPDEKVTRTKEEAEVLAKELLERAKAGQEFDALVQEYTDDQHPGIYRMSNTEVPPDPSVQEYSRERMVKAFGDVSFSLEVGEIGMASYDPAASKYGWHIIKRLR